MEFNIVINQAALRKWVGKINLNDAAIHGFIRLLTPNDPTVRHYMLNGYFRLDAGWIQRQNPLLDVSEDWIRRTLKKLKDLHLIDSFAVAGKKKRLMTYGRVSLEYMEEEQRVERAIEEAEARYAEKTPGAGENSRMRRKLPVRENDPGESPIDHKKDQCKADGTDPPHGSDAAAFEREESPRLTESDIEAMLMEKVPEYAEARAEIRKREKERKAAVEQHELPGIAEGENP